MNILCREVQSSFFTIRAWLENYPRKEEPPTAMNTEQKNLLFSFPRLVFFVLFYFPRLARGGRIGLRTRRYYRRTGTGITSADSWARIGVHYRRLALLVGRSATPPVADAAPRGTGQ